MEKENFNFKNEDESPLTWGEAEKVMSEKQYFASWQRAKALRGSSPETQELLSHSNLTLTLGESEYIGDGESTYNPTITGEVEGKNVDLHCATKQSYSQVSHAPMTTKDGHNVPDITRYPVYDSIFSGEVDGVAVSAEEAEILWRKYENVADITDLDQRLSKFAQE